MCTSVQLCPDGQTPQELHEYVTESGESLLQDLYCPTESSDEPPAITSAMITRAFQRIPVPAPKLIIQPPNGETLVNFATNFYTEAEPFERSVRLAGQRVDLRIWPSSFAWDFGDGEQTTTSEPGAAYPDLRITHEYAAAGSVGPSVDITYSAEFRVNGGAWEPVVGTVTSEGDPVGLQVRTASPTLVGY